MLGPLLFTVFINDLDEGIINKILKFADDTKIIGKVTKDAEVNSLKQDLDKLFNRSKKWQMSFNLEKCKIMHVGKNNKRDKFEMGGRQLGEVDEEKDLGVVVTSDMKVARQCAIAAKKGYQILGIIIL